MMNKKILLTGALLVGILQLSAQQDPMTTMFIQNPAVANPAYAGSKEVMNITLSHRQQWSGVDGAPETTNLNLHTPIKDKNIGVGFAFVNDKIGPTTTSGVFGDFSYKLPVSAAGSVRLGLRFGASLFSADLNNVQVVQNGVDESFSQNVSGEVLPSAGFGVYYSDDRIFGGASIPNFFKGQAENSSTIVFEQNQHLFLIAGTIFDINADIKLKPAVSARLSQNIPASIDARVMALFYEKIWIGGMYRMGESFGGILQLQLSDQFLIGYSYDYVSNELQSASTGTHEFILSYNFIFNKGKINSPRYF